MLRLLSIMPFLPLVDPWTVRVLSNRVHKRLILARVVLRSLDLGDLVGLHSEHCGSLSVVIDLTDLTLPAKVHVVIPMIGGDGGE